MNGTFICALAALWYLQAASLPKLYYRLQGRRDVDVKRLRKLEKAGLKVTKLTLDIKFFESCIELGVCPPFFKFKAPNLPVYKRTKGIYSKVLSDQIRITSKELKSATSRYNAELGFIASKISTLEKTALCHLLKKEFEVSALPCLKIHNGKLLHLWKEDRSRSPNCLLNLSDVKLSVLEENALRLGLKNHILPKKLNEGQLKVEFEKLLSSITYDNNVILTPDFKEKLKSMVKSYVSEANGLCSVKQNQFLHRTLHALSLNKNIKVCKFDKGNGVVVLNCTDYFDKLDTIILDTSKFEEIICDHDSVHPIIANESRIKSFLYRNVKKHVDDGRYQSITPSGSQPGKVYGLCKVHKVGNPLRPLISMISTAEYKLAKYLDDFIKPNINTTYSVNSTSAFMDKLNNFSFSAGDKLVSFDVCSLYTNVPLEESILLISDLVYSEKSKRIPPFSKEIFTKLLRYATSGMFLYRDRLFKQVDGVAMGSPLGPSIANFFLGHLEQYKLMSNASFNPKLYIRYVDDIFAVFDKDAQFEPFLDHINSQHPNIKFTVEKSIDSLPFLNTEIKIVGDSFESIIYRKASNTNVLLNFSSICPLSWKKGIIFGALNRAKIVCSNTVLLSQEINKLRTIFWKNGYPISLFNKVVDLFEKRQSDDIVSVADDNDEKRYIIKIPYVGTLSHEFKNKIITFFNYELKVTVSPVFNTFKVSNYFSLKSQTPKQLMANVVYKYTCLCDTNITYIGETKRHLAVRSSEHLLYEEKHHKSEIKTHIINCNVCKNSSLDNFDIIQKCNSEREIKINEAISILRFNPRLNKQLFNKGALYTLKVYN